jgi:hypothetical protein
MSWAVAVITTAITGKHDSLSLQRAVAETPVCWYVSNFLS